MRTERRSAALLSAAALAGWVMLARHAMPYTTDSAAYVEAARAVGRGEGFLVTTYGVRPVDVDRSPLTLFPPGYPLAIAAATALGVDPRTAAVTWPGIAFACMPWLFWRLFRRVVDPWPALVVAGMVTWSAGMVEAALHAWSDVPFLALALASFDLLLATLARRSAKASFAAGMVVGAACLTRNVGYALVAAHAAGFAIAAAVAAVAPAFVMRAAFAWLAGCGVSYGWWVVHNVLLFGALQPYTMSPSELGVAATVAQAARAAAASLFGTWHPLAVRIALPLVAAALAAATFSGLRRLRAPDAGAADRLRLVAWSIFAAYGSGGLALVVIARARWAWGEPIGERHLLQYQWIVVLAIASVLAGAARRRTWTRGVLAMLMVVYSVAHARPVARQLRHAHDHTGPELAVVEAFAPRVQAAVRSGALVASNVAPLLRIVSGLPVRQINAAATPDALRDTVVPLRDLYLALFPCETFCRGLYPDERYPLWLDADPETLAESGYEIVDRSGGAFLLHAVTPRPPAATPPPGPRS